MPTYPYISGAGSIVKAFDQLRKGFPPTVDAAYLQRFQIAASNESYLISVLRFLGLIDEEGKKQEGTVDFFYGNDETFQSGLDSRLRESYKQLFDEMGDDALSASRENLGHWFRSADKTSDLLGKRQAGTFLALAALAGHTEAPSARTASTATKPRSTSGAKSAARKPKKPTTEVEGTTPTVEPRVSSSHPDVGLTVRIEVNLPAGGDAETYDAIFASIKRNLIS